MGSGWEHLADDGRIELSAGIEGGEEARQASSHDDYIVTMDLDLLHITSLLTLRTS
jgi:hypothetical protein